MRTTYKIILLAAVIMTCAPVSAQKENRKYVLSGTVTDGTGRPVPGAMILIDRKNTDVVTGEDGKYRVRVKPASKEITVFTFTGATGTVSIDRRRVIDFSISGSAAEERKKDAAAKEEDVSVGYGKVKSSELTTPVSKVDGDGNKYASYSNIYDMLRGTVAGVQVTGKSITIQGTGTTNPNNQPLFVVDGVIVGSIDDIVPVQVKSVELLKGSSASIYGSRGANGVLIITLKGHEEKKRP
ncbi:MAG: TonB-dependent receptor plug domain-containing protein [Bacteroidales bacterium]|jgi:TonB-dependent SusC/RagA subfamily outer membrane receptor|nr:TonB-dependent receptor plug domain-containing protein [Bacteroidales bacterium]